MNLIYLHTHDMGRYNQLYGYAARTPNFMSVAQDGILFRNAHCAGPTCSPSRAALLTGMSPHSAGILGLAHRGFEIADPKQHLSSFLRDNGYRTALFGQQHEVKDPRRLGYDVVEVGDGDPIQRDRRVAELAAKYIETLDGDKPFFMSVGLFYPHREYINELGDINPNHVMPPACLPDTPETRKDYAEYTASVEYADKCAGLVLSALRNSRFADNTVILLTTDHGIAFPFMKCNLYDTGTGVTLAMKVPGYEPGRATNAMVSHIDVYPTLCDLLGLEKPSWLEGRSLLPILDGDAEQVNDFVFSEVTYHAAYEPKRCIRGLRYKYIERFDTFLTPVLPNFDDGYSKRLLMAGGLSGKALPKYELYDLTLDPLERINLVDAPEHAATLAEYRSKLREWMEKTNDPLLCGGRVPKPAGAFANRQGGDHPQNMDYET